MSGLARPLSLSLLLMLTPAVRAPAQQHVAEAPFVATPVEVVERMLRLAGVGKDDVVYDLGSGDGRIPIAAAARYGARGVGVEINEDLVRQSRQSADSAGVGARVEFRQADLFEADIRDATVVTLFLGPALNERLRPRLLDDLRPGTRIVSYFFEMGDWKPDSSVVFEWGEARSDAPLFLWVVPAAVAGTWELRVGDEPDGASYELRLQQRYQQVTGSARANGHGAALTDVRLAGDRVTFRLGDGRGREAALRFSGRVAGDAMQGTVAGEPAGEPTTWIARRSSSTPSGR